MLKIREIKKPRSKYKELLRKFWTAKYDKAEIITDKRIQSVYMCMYQAINDSKYKNKIRVSKKGKNLYLIKNKTR